MRVHLVCVSAHPEGNLEVRQICVLCRKGHVTDGQVPVVVDEVDPVVHGFRSELVVLGFFNVRLSIEERDVSASKFVSKFDCETDRAGICGSFFFPDVSSAAVNLPPITDLGFLSRAVVTNPWSCC